jgi:hypothetical protein
MSFSNSTETDILTYIFDTTAPAWAGNANFWLALYTADPTETGTAITNEVAYSGYARVSISRTTGFTVSGNTASNAELVQFPATTASGAADCTYGAVVTTASGAGQIIARGALLSTIPTSANNVTPQFAAGLAQFIID